MEDVSTKGVQSDFYEGLTAGQVESTIVHLAKFHAFTATLPRDLLSRFRVFEYGRLDEMEEQLVERVLNMGSPYFYRHEKTLRAFMAVHNKLKTDVHKRFGIRPVLSHGDLWSNNLFFNRTENGGAGDELSSIIDWQTCHKSTGLSDVIRIIFSGVNAPLRKERMNEWLDLYFDTVQEECRKLNILPSVEYSNELRKALFEEQRHFELTFVFLCFPTLFPQSKNDMHRNNLMERMETLFEEGREQYENIGQAKFLRLLIGYVFTVQQGLLSGIYSLFGVVFCSNPMFNFFIASCGAALFAAESSANFLLALDRLAEIISPKFGKFLFSGRAWLWTMASSIFGLYDFYMDFGNVPVDPKDKIKKSFIVQPQPAATIVAPTNSIFQKVPTKSKKSSSTDYAKFGSHKCKALIIAGFYCDYLMFGIPPIRQPNHSK
uniref:CHK kinase-like domain-containing protein n=1 Tax=Globodera rostochiensis TaxID=31243 RepID=A0A914HX65_GLORO